MNLQLLLQDLHSKDIKLAVEDGSLAVNAPAGALTAELRQVLQERKTELLALLEGNEAIEVSALPPLIADPAHRYDPFPLTDMQYAFWVGRSGVLELGNVSNHGYYEIEGNALDTDRLEAVLVQIIARHDMLRAVVLPDGQQQILETVPPYKMKVLDLRECESAEIDARLEDIRDRLSHQILQADLWPLFEFRATLLPAGQMRLHVSYDLLVFDAWSLFRLFDEWIQLYQNPEGMLPPLDLSYRDYVLAEQALQQTPLYQRSQDYWLSRLDTLPPAPELPLAKNPKELQQHRNKRYESRLDRTQWQQLKQKAAREGITPSSLLLAAFAEIVALWSNSSRFTLNLALFNRLPLHRQVNDLLGDFTSVTLLAVEGSSGESFRDRALGLQKQLWQDLEHRYFSGVRVTRELARKKGSAPSAMPIVFTSTLGFSSIGQDTRTFSHFGELVYGISQASQAWMDIQVWEEKEELTFNWDAVEGLFPEGLIANMFEAYSFLLKQLAAPECLWGETIGQLLPPAQLAARNAANATDAPIPQILLHELFAARVPQQPDRLAVISSQRHLTYQQLYECAHQLGHRLRRLGAAPNCLVAVVMEKGWEQIVAVMGILVAGAAYVPIDPSLPSERFSYLLENSDAQIILTQSRFADQLVRDRGIPYLCVDSEDFSSESKEPLSSIQSADDLAYVIYTSGSTGLPKGVMISHRGIVNAIVHTNDRFQVNHRDRMLALTALNHDMSVYDIFGLLAAGGTIVMPDAARAKDPHHWVELICREGVTLWNSVPAMLEMLVDCVESQSLTLSSSLRLATLGGDWIPLSLPDRLRAFVPNAQIVSVGGPTETTLWNICYAIEQIDPNWKSIPYGQPMANSKYYIFNDALEDCPIWVSGQMYSSGVQVAKGYWCNEEKTRDNFIIHPRTGERIYGTGDLGRYRPDGNIEFLGRADFQIKIRGHRIEAGEIEAVLTRHPAVKAAIIIALGQGQSKESLLAYIIPEGKIAPDFEELRSFLSSKLPDYMIPSVFLFLEAFPLSANGKVDRRSLPTKDVSIEQVTTTYIAPQNNIEQTIASIFQTVLNLEKVGTSSNFFEIGGNSLLIAKVYNQLKNEFPDEFTSISLLDLYKYPTIRALAQQVKPQREERSPISETVELAEKVAAGKNRLRQKFKKTR
ncbi:MULTISPECIES: amino acid adenylation domain-containing protein [unclassified Roseofilum]|uniref:non-ribosomal peptide synthetase n=1 Tax=unclassified Roseofilum TaxID=2620099 RepID=UPI001B046BFB|nr:MULTISPECIES: amino acid adenylation domain-containing protein [unclassified Roseofilum]MBP0007661.1 amino acid adenylation domain-containing protein [Roseofilum sp. Belize Diploria]MBP0033543.1 amino acid adenylation domain-containing protein [Roseofilum sp. Belize BBD 4]